jgi:hypothetical protein
MNPSLDELSTQGSSLLLNSDNARSACENLNSWIDLVRIYLAGNHPNTGLVAEWLAIGSISHNSQYPLSFDWTPFKSNVRKRLTWLSNLNNKVRIKEFIASPIGVIEHPLSVNNSKLFISSERIKELESLNSSKFELKKLIALCNELNICHKDACWYAVIALTRTILNYVPPIFGQPNFESVVANHNGKSLKPVLEELHKVSKNIADHHLHEPAKQNEALLTEQQVNFGHELDVLLQEISKKLKNT